MRRRTGATGDEMLQGRVKKEFSRVERGAMLRALALARRGSGSVAPNPMVGAVVLSEGKIVGYGWHKRYGFAHAEVEALEMAGERARGATLIVTLEPCNHHGQTPPCTERIIAAGVSRVVGALPDPNRAVRGGGFARLQEAGITVESGLCQDIAAELNIGWFQWLKTGRPHVLLKLAITLDGKVTRPRDGERWITSDVTRAQVHRLRRHVDAILVGSGTVIADNPFLTNRSGIGRQPVRVVIDSTLRIPPTANVYRRPAESERIRKSPFSICFTTSRASYHRRRELELSGVEVVVAEGTSGKVDLDGVVSVLGKMGVQTVLCEGGPTLGTMLLDEGLAHRFLLYQAPFVVGDGGLSFYLGGKGVLGHEGLALSLRLARRIGKDHLLLYDNRRSSRQVVVDAPCGFEDLHSERESSAYEGSVCLPE